MSRGRKPRRSKSSGLSRRWRALRPAIAVLLTIGAVIAILASLGWLGDEALRGIGSRERYRVAFADIDCDAPPGLDRERFLAEVRFVSDFPESFYSLEESDQRRLAEAFARHPWVESIEGISVEAGNLVRVALKFRTPVLAVRVASGAVRLVDGNGILLPEADVPPGVAALGNPVAEPQTQSGQVWENATVKRAVELVKAYSPVRLELRWTGWRLEQPDGTVLHVVQPQ